MKNRIFSDARVWISLTFMAVGAFVALTAFKWPFRTALFPVAIGICVFFMSLAELLLGLFGKDKDGSRKDDTDAAPATPATKDEQKIDFRRTVSIFAWIFGFFLTIIFFGFPIAVILLVFLYLKVQSRESWGLTLALTGATGVIFYVLFIWISETHYPDGLLIRWLG